MKSFKRLLRLLPLLAVSLIVFSESSAQTYEDFVKQREKEFEEYKKQEEKAFKEFKQARDEYIEKMDSAYTEYLRQRWEEFQLFAGKKPPERPKPVDQPVLSKKIDKHSSESMKTSKVKKRGKTEESLDLPILQKSTPENYSTLPVSFSFYGTQLNYLYDEDFINDFPADVNEENIANQLKTMNGTHYTDLIKQLSTSKNELNLNDWGYYLLIKKMTEQLVPRSTNTQRFLQWFLLIKSNYRIKLGYKEEGLSLLIPTVNEMYDVPFFTFNNIRYYSIHGNSEKIYTYEKDFPEARQLMDLNLYHTINLPAKPVSKTYRFNHQGEEQTIKIRYNQNLIDFFRDYPLADIKVYFDASVSVTTKESLVENLGPAISDRNEKEAVSYLLNLVQKSFDYKTDREQFGREKFFFTDEIFHYPYSDCEDRSVFFSYLVKELLGLKVIGLGYSDHMATAVHFKEAVEGDYIEYNGDRYVICDPTYVNAPVGKTQPAYRKEQAEIIELLNNQYQAKIADAIWNKILKAGGDHGSSSDDIVFDDNDNAYVTGYFSGDMKLEDHRVRSVDRSNDLFIAKFNPEGQVIWLKSYGGKGNDIGFTLRLDEEDQNLYVSGSFTDELTIENKTFQAGETGDVFLTKVSPGGDIIWANQSGLESPGQKSDLMFTSSFGAGGELKWTRMYEEMESYTNFGIDLDKSGNPVIKGAIYATPGFITSTRSFDAYAEFDYMENLKSENDKLLENAYDRSIAGLFAVINLIQNSGTSLPGSVAQNALDRYNPEFRKNSPSIYKNIGRVRFIRNSKGIVIVRTDNGESVNFSYLRVEDESKLKIFRYNSGNAQINVLSGIKIGKAIVWYDLNHIKLYHNTGNLLFDYDEDHTRKKVSLSEDILY